MNGKKCLFVAKRRRFTRIRQEEKMELETPVPSRHEKSLGVLTMKFVSLLQQAEDGVLDLNVVSGAATGVGFGCFLLF